MREYFTRQLRQLLLQSAFLFQPFLHPAVPRPLRHQLTFRTFLTQHSQAYGFAADALLDCGDVDQLLEELSDVYGNSGQQTGPELQQKSVRQQRLHHAQVLCIFHIIVRHF